MIAKLIDDHRRIIQVADEIETLLSEAPPANMLCLSRARWTLTRELLQHLAVEDRLLAQHGRPALDDGLTARFRAYLARWSGPAMAERWAAFRIETVELLTMLRTRIDHEEQVIYPALQAAG